MSASVAVSGAGHIAPTGKRSYMLILISVFWALNTDRWLPFLFWDFCREDARGEFVLEDTDGLPDELDDLDDGIDDLASGGEKRETR